MSIILQSFMLSGIHFCNRLVMNYEKTDRRRTVYTEHLQFAHTDSKYPDKN